jgi:hypothetical protein
MKTTERTPVYEIYALKYAGPLKSKLAMLLWASSIDLIFPGHDAELLTRYPKVAQDVTRLA